MRGTGFQCDHCGLRVVMDARVLYPGDWKMPDGWLSVAVNNESSIPWEFCSWRCTLNHAADQLGIGDDDA